MTKKQLFNGINNADDRFIIEALEDDTYLYSDIEKKRRFGGVIKTALPCAACAALIFGAVVGGRFFGAGSPVSSLEGNALSADNADVSDVSSDSTDASSEIPEQNASLSDGLLEQVTPDTAAFWEGELPVLPVKEFDNQAFELSLDIESGWAGHYLETERGSAVYAVADGEVYFVGERSAALGKSIVVKHNDRLYTVYDTVDADCGIPVDVGDTVKAGQVIGYAGLALGYGAFGDGSSECTLMNGISYYVFTYDPLNEHYIGKTELLNNWKNSGLALPLDNIDGSFDFGNVSALISRGERVIPAPEGANVYAVDSGTVVRAADYGGGIGHIVCVMHDYGDVSAGVFSLYYHLGSDLTVKEGDTVERGQIIGHISGSSLCGTSGLGYCIESWRQHGNPMIKAEFPE